MMQHRAVSVVQQLARSQAVLNVRVHSFEIGQMLPWMESGWQTCTDTQPERKNITETEYFHSKSANRSYT